MSKSTKHTTLFQHKHVLEFGFEIVELQEKGNMSVVMGVHCLFYMYCNRDVRLVSCKRKPFISSKHHSSNNTICRT